MSFGLAGGSCALSAESPVFDVTIEDSTIIYTATPASSNVPGFKPHINFPYMKDRADGTLEVTMNVGQTHGAGVFGLRSWSYDGGQTWTTPTNNYVQTPYLQLIRPAGQVSHGVSMAFDQPAGATQWFNTHYTSTDGGHAWGYETATFNSDVTYINAYNSLNDIVDDNGTLLMLSQAQRPNSSTFETVLFACTNNGTTWNRRSTVSAFVAGPNASMGSEGPNEGALVKLDNGKLLSVFRTGQPFPSTNVNLINPSLFWSMSSDHGQTWSPAKMLGVSGVSPFMQKLDDGSVALTFGRYGGKMMFADKTGLRWTKPAVLYNGPGSGHVEMRQVPNGKYVYIHDQSGFYPPGYNASPPAGYVYDNDQSANLIALTLDIQRSNVIDDHVWAMEYHGDVTPDALAEPWGAQLSAGASGYLWAELGQDYLRFDTGASGAARHYYYGIGGGSTWSRMDFSDGVVADFRARVGSESTAESAAMLFLGDGSNGYVSLELTGTFVGLEGLGGNSGQKNYRESAHPGFRTSDWHDYRLVVEPVGGVVTARLFLDGNYAAPILTQPLDPTLIDELRFGDQTGANNGVLDVDFLRFTRLNLSPGDADFDGDVDLNDLGALATSYGAAADATWSMGDFDRDGDVDLNDLGALATNYAAGSAQAFADFQTLNIPEPALIQGTVLFLFSGPACGAFRRVNRRRFS